MFYYLCLCRMYAFVYCQLRKYLFPVVQTWVLDVTDELASMLVCVEQHVPLKQMQSGLPRRQACEHRSAWLPQNVISKLQLL